MGDIIARVISFILSIFITLFGEALMFLVDQLIELATYNKFVVSSAVVNGWVIVRDLCNMFFIVVLLMIAIATILKIEMYHYKKLLGRLVIMAVLINFSKTVCGIIIDFAQVLTLTFVNGFKAAAGGNFAQALGLTDMMALEGGQENITAWQVAGAYALALVMLVIACIVVLVMLAVFLIRMVMLWILIVLSPLAFFLTTFPQGQKYASQWWSQFGNYVIVGPVMAFFLWLSLISVTTLSPNDKPDPLPGRAGEPMQRIGISKIGGKDKMQAFVIAIGMLIGSLVITQQMGIMGSSLAGSAVAGIKKAGMAPARKAWSSAKKTYNRGADFAYSKTGIAMPGSKLRTEMKENREKALHEDRKYKGQAVSADRVAGGRYGIGMAAAVLADPGLARKMGTWSVFKMAVGRDKSKESMKRYGELQKKKADAARMAEDPEGTYRDMLRRDHKNETGLADKAGKEAKEKEGIAEEKGKKLSEHQKDLMDQVSTMEGEAAGLEGTEQGSLTRAAELGKELTGINKEIDDTQKVKAELDGASLQNLVNKFKTEIPQEFGEKVKKHIQDGKSQGEAEQLAAQDKKNEVDQKLTDLQTRKSEKENQRAGAERTGRDARSRLEVVKKNINEVKNKDMAVKAVLDIKDEAKVARGREEIHKKRAKDIGETAKLEGAAFAAKAREHYGNLINSASFVGAISSALTPELQANIGRMQTKMKEMLKEELGRDPTDDELKQRVSKELGKKLGAPGV